MNAHSIKNIVFDVGNVIVVWSPVEIVRRTFGNDRDAVSLAQQIFQHELWKDLNKGYFDEEEAKKKYRHALGFDQGQVDLLFHHIKESQELVDGTVALIKRLHQSGYPLYALTDNVNEIVTHLRNRYDFWQYFQGAIVSAEVHCLKPGSEIFHHLLNQYGLEASKTLFIDDVLPNVEGARQVGLAAVQFNDSKQCEHDLLALGLHF